MSDWEWTYETRVEKAPTLIAKMPDGLTFPNGRCVYHSWDIYYSKDRKYERQCRRCIYFEPVKGLPQR